MMEVLPPADDVRAFFAFAQPLEQASSRRYQMLAAAMAARDNVAAADFFARLALDLRMHLNDAVIRAGCGFPVQPDGEAPLALPAERLSFIDERRALELALVGQRACQGQYRALFRRSPHVGVRHIAHDFAGVQEHHVERLEERLSCLFPG